MGVTPIRNCRLYRKSEGQQAKLCYLGHLMMENRNGFVVEGQVTPASGQAEREAAVAMLEQLPRGGPKDPGRRQGLRSSSFARWKPMGSSEESFYEPLACLFAMTAWCSAKHRSVL
jgi:hypothetical protein